MRRTWLIFSQAVTVAVAVLFVVATLKPEWLGRSPVAMLPQIVSIRTEVPGPASSAAAAGPVGLAGAARRAAPAVVSISASKAPQRNPHADDPWSQFFGEMARRPDQPQVGLGSGVIMSPEGYLLTNNHVVAGATDILVQLSDGRQADARLVGTDPESDLAVLKIELEGLPVATLGESQTLQVGDAVLAIGNPFNVGQTVTSGIVSALNRDQLGLSTFENFIQTDAAINPGNSGGALVDASGLLVGINTAIYSRSGGSLGIGFAIPSDTARQVMEDLIRDGTVRRGWLGVNMLDLNDDLARGFNLRADRGVLVTGVFNAGPAERAGVRPGDVVQRVDGVEVADRRALLNQVAQLAPGTQIKLELLRDGKAVSIEMRLGQRPPT